jgi:hypothetical protein
MNMNIIENNNRNVTPTRTLTEVCRASCKKIWAQIEALKSGLVAEFKGAFGIQEHLLELALNEAEALAWETEYPHLLFPTLAVEKAQSVASWAARQQAIQRKSWALSFAA